PDSRRRRPDPLVTPHKPVPRTAYVGGTKPDGGAPSSRSGRRGPRSRRRFRWIPGWRMRLTAFAAVALLAILAFQRLDAGDGTALPSLRTPGPIDLPTPQGFPEQDTVRTREGRWLTRYAADEVLQERAERYVNRYRPEGAVVVVCDLRTGQIRALVERDSNQTTSLPRLALGTTFPAASLAKIVTAAAVLEEGIAN